MGLSELLEQQNSNYLEVKTPGQTVDKVDISFLNFYSLKQSPPLSPNEWVMCPSMEQD